MSEGRQRVAASGPPAWFDRLLAADFIPRRMGNEIWSVLPPGTPAPSYDGRARMYDRLIGSRAYNRLAWGTTPAVYTGFARRAAGDANGLWLDAGCGTLVSTLPVHATSRRPTVLVDLSLDMLRVAHGRLVAALGGRPDHLVLLQADITDLPFRDGAFETLLCPGMLHLFDDVEAMARELARVTAPAGRLFMSSLVTDRWLSARYLDVLHRTGEVARPRGSAELLRRLNAAESGLAGSVTVDVEGGMAFVTAQIPPPAA